MDTVYFKQLFSHSKKPEYGTDGSVGADLFSAEEIEIPPGEHRLIGTGIATEFNNNFVLLICPRSGLALKNGITVLNAPGVVDPDFRAEIKVILINHSQLPYKVALGERIAQVLLVPIDRAIWTKVNKLSDTTRGSGGFGSTGK